MPFDWRELEAKMATGLGFPEAVWAMAESTGSELMEDGDDIGNTKAWREILSDILSLAPPEKRLLIAELAVVNEAMEKAGREQAQKRGIKFKLSAWAEISKKQSYRLKSVERLKSLVIQVFARDITNDNSDADAAKLLFSEHKFGAGSGRLLDYIGDLPGIKSPAKPKTLAEYRQQISDAERQLLGTV